MLFAYFLFFLISVFFTMLGLGGGGLYVPLFTFLGFDLKTVAVPSGIFLVVIGSLSASISYAKNKLVDFKAAFCILCGSILASSLTQLLFYRNASSKALWLVMVILLILVGLKSLFLPDSFKTIKVQNKLNLFLILFLGGLFMGFSSVSTGIGGGAIVVPMLVFLSYDLKRAIGTSSFIIVFTSLNGFLWHFFSSYDHSKMGSLVLFAVIVLVGGILGSYLTAKKMKSSHTRILMGIILGGTGVYLLIKNFILS